MEVALGVLHHKGNHSIHAKRQVIGRLAVGLQEGDIAVDVWRHAVGDVELERGLAFLGLYPE